VTGLPDQEEPYYLEARIQRRLTEDPDTAEPGVRVEVRDGVVHLTGAVASEERRGQLVRTAGAEAGGLPVRDELLVPGVRPPATAEDLR
jgi:osmotically-inducible protein OsmY